MLMQTTIKILKVEKIALALISFLSIILFFKTVYFYCSLCIFSDQFAYPSG